MHMICKYLYMYIYQKIDGISKEIGGVSVPSAEKLVLKLAGKNI